MMDFRKFYYRNMTTCLAIISVAYLSACAPLHNELISDSKLTPHGTGTPVLAAAETEAVATRALDSADDPEIWVDSKDSSRALIYATDKKAGLYVYDLTGKQVQFLSVGPMNNVDLRSSLAIEGLPETVIAASDRVKGGAALFKLDPVTLQTSFWGFVPMPTSEAYGFCMGVTKANQLTFIMVGKNGDVTQSVITSENGQPKATVVRQFAVGTQSEGCVADDATGRLYIAEENVALWQYGLDPASGNARTAVDTLPSQKLVADIEGLTLLREGPQTFLIASSQGDSAFAVWRVEGETPVYQGRFSVYPGNGIDAVTGTDGVAALGGQVGPYGKGVVVMQDDSDTDGETPATTRQRQNFKIVDWNDIRKSLAIQ
jgi:3-phytase